MSRVAGVKLNAQQTLYVTWAGLGLVAVGIGYALIKWVIPAVTKAAADSATKVAGTATSGVANAANAALQGLSTNDLTKGSTDFSGNPVDYSGHGPVSSVAAATNNVSGGVLASFGEELGSEFFTLFNGDYNPNAPTSETNSSAPGSTTSQPGLNADMGGQNFGVTGGGW